MSALLGVVVTSQSVIKEGVSKPVPLGHGTQTGGFFTSPESEHLIYTRIQEYHRDSLFSPREWSEDPWFLMSVKKKNYAYN